EHDIEAARGHTLTGTADDLRTAAVLYDKSLDRRPGDSIMRAERAMVRAHLWLEFGEDEAAAREALDDAPASNPATIIARAALAFGSGDPAAAAAEIAELQEAGDLGDGPVGAEAAWVSSLVEVAEAGDDAERLGKALEQVDRELVALPGNAALRRIRARLLLQLGKPEDALAELDRARELARAHLGLAADEALFNALLGREWSGVASVADQLLEQGEALPVRDRFNTLLARGVVHVHLGETAEGLARLDEAWAGLPKWDRLAVRLAIETALEAGDAKRARAWLDEAGLPKDETATFGAWAKLVDGDVMAALADLSALPQEDPRVGHLQALALVEQGRFAEAEPWILRTNELLPGRIDIEVAGARVELRVGDAAKLATAKPLALRKLQALAEEEPFAPRAWTGLGEAYLLQDDPDPRKARDALERAIEREPVPAEAMLLLADIWNKKRAADPQSPRKALELLERAVEVNPHLPRYKEQLAYFLADAAQTTRARTLLRELVDEEGIGWRTITKFVQLSAEAGDKKVDYDELLAEAEKLGADPRVVTRERARALLVADDKESVLKAQGQLAALVAQDPKDVEARVLWASTYVRQFDRKEAELAVRRGFPHLPESEHGRLYLAWAEIESRMGKAGVAAPRARSAWLRMLDEDRPASELLVAADLATKLWVRQENKRIATAIAEQLTTRLPYHAEAWTIRARTELATGEAAAARTSADRAIELDPDNPRAHEIRGHCLLRFGQKDKARAAYERA
ncbi:MAG TPA: tetratricopeptide repeat protein, partial [Nannocystaceae bacterium]|nr:tetratricopeptide repeat protein [Nannocystaceae bacterium]